MMAMLLAAGQGKRLQPLTLTTPKPLVPLGPYCLIEHHLFALARAGFYEVVINVSYLAGAIMERLGDGSRYHLDITYSYEPEVGGLETGGGILQALPLLGTEPFLVISSDIYTNFDYANFQDFRLKGLAHLVLVDNRPEHPEGDFSLTAQGLLGLSEPKFTYANIGVLSPDLFKGRRPGFFPLRDVLKPAIVQGKVTGEYFSGHWHNVGTVEQLELARSQSVP